MKNENDLTDELQSRIPSVGDAYWESIDERLAAIEASQDFDEVDGSTDTAANVTRRTSVSKAEDSTSRGRYLLVAAAIVALLGLGAIVLNNRTGPGSDTVASLDVAGQADGSSESQQGVTDEQQGAGDRGGTALAGDQDPPLQALRARLNGEVATTTSNYCFRSEPNTVKLARPDAVSVRSPWTRLGLFRSDGGGHVTVATWDDATDPNDVDGALFHSTVVPGALNGQFEASFRAGTLAGLQDEYRETLPVTLTDLNLTVGNVEMSLVACAEIQDAIDRVYGTGDTAGFDPQVVQTTGPIRVDGETPWQAMRDRLGDSGAGLGVAGPFCFASDRGYSILRPDYEELFKSPTIASVSILADGQLDLVMKQGDEVTSQFAAIVAGDANGVFQIELSIVEAEGANWFDTVVQPIVLTDESLIVREWPLPVVDCAGIQDEIARVRELAAEMRAWQAENAEPDWTRWRFIDGPVNFRATPGLDGEIIGSWVGDERAVLGTGVEVEADGYVWVELAAEGDRLGGWVSKDFVRPDFGDAGPRCFADDQTAVSLNMGSAEEQVGGTVYTLVDGEITYVGVTGRIVDTTADGITEYLVLAQPIFGDVVESQTWELSDSGFATSYGLLGPINCAERANENALAASAITEYPELPEEPAE